MATAKKLTRTIAGRDVTVSNPDKVFFPAHGYTKLQLIDYYVAVADGALGGAGGRPMQLKRYVHGVEGEFFYQKRAPENRPAWVDTVELSFPSGRTAHEIVLGDAAQLAWIVNLGCIDLHPHAVRASDLDHPDELRIDLDPVPGVPWSQIVEVAHLARAVLAEHGLASWPKTSGSRGIHVYARIEPRWGFGDVRHAALAVAREVERRAPGRATSKWWKEEREGVFLDYNQNAKDRTTASAYSVRPTPDARVSLPLAWDELDGSDPAAFTLATVPERFARVGDPWRDMDAHAGRLDTLLELGERQRREQGEAPLPPHFPKAEGEPPRVQPSRRRKSDSPSVKPSSTGGRRRPTKPVITIARAQKKEDALAGLERWKLRNLEIVRWLEPKDILVDGMRGRNTTWTRVRINLEHVPEAERPKEETPDPDFDPWSAR